MELCEEFSFCPERSVIIRNVDSGIELSDVQEVFSNVGVISRIQEVSEGILCEFSDCLSDTWLEDENPYQRSQEWIVEPVMPKPVKTADDSGDPSLFSCAVTLDNVLLNATHCFQQQLSEIADQYGVEGKGLERRAYELLSCNREHSKEGGRHKVSFNTPSDIDLAVQAKQLETPISTPVRSKTFLHQSTPMTIPMDVQRVVVEHVVKSANEGAVLNNMKYKVKSFSGSNKVNNEVDYDIWRVQIGQVIKDGDLTESVKKRTLIGSLLPPALNVALCAGDNASALEYFEELEKAYGSVEKGDELFFRFIETHQIATEKASEYLSRLHSVLQRVIERGGLERRYPNQQLLKQFIRGCWDDTLIDRLCVKELVSTPAHMCPSYTQFLSDVRAYEKERETKELRKRRYLSNAPVKASNKTMTVHENASEDNLSSESDGKDNSLSLRVEKLEESLKEALLHASVGQDVSASNVQCYTVQEGIVEGTQKPTVAPRNKSNRLFFCYNCGEDGHALRNCGNASYAELVQQKLKQRWNKKIRPEKDSTTSLN